MEILLADTLSDELVTWDHEHTTRVVSVVILAEDTDREHADIYDLSLDISDRDRVTDMVLPEDKKECQNRENKILQRNNQCTESDGEEVHTITRLERDDDEDDRHDRECTYYIYTLHLTIVAQVELRMFLIGRVIIFREYRCLHTRLDTARDDLDTDPDQYHSKKRPLLSDEIGDESPELGEESHKRENQGYYRYMR
jgi:hypothetical protein